MNLMVPYYTCEKGIQNYAELRQELLDKAAINCPVAALPNTCPADTAKCPKPAVTYHRRRNCRTTTIFYTTTTTTTALPTTTTVTTTEDPTTIETTTTETTTFTTTETTVP